MNTNETVNALAKAALELQLRMGEGETDHSTAIDFLLREICSLTEQD